MKKFMDARNLTLTAITMAIMAMTTAGLSGEARPTLWLIGDSTVNVSTEGQSAWGQVLGEFLEETRVRLENRAIGGRSSRTFLTEGRWEAVRGELRPGDWLIVQFGHNDSSPVNDDRRARGTLPGTGEDSVEIDNLLTGQREVVYSFGHYMRQFAREAREAGASVVVCSPVPRKIWKDGRIQRERETYAGWAETVAREEGVYFLDLQEIVARGYEAAGPAAVEFYFADEHTHHTEAGAKNNARAVVAGLRGLPGDPLASLLAPAGRAVAAYPPREWVDAATGRRVRRLSEEPGTASLYFHQNPYTAEGDRMVVTTPRGISTIHVDTGEIKEVVAGPARVLVVGRKTRLVYFTRREGEVSVVYAAHLDTGEERRIAVLPGRAGVSSVNSDETLLLGSRTEVDTPPLRRGRGSGAVPAAVGGETAGGTLMTPRGGPPDAARGGAQPQGEWMRQGDRKHPVTGRDLTFAEQKEWSLDDRLEARIPMEMFVVDTRTGALRVVHRATDWLNHLQFSPTNPELILFCHEGPWHKVDRIWTVRADGTGLAKVHARTMNMEIAGHEFFSPDGETIWYDLQTPRGEVFWLAGYELKTGRRTWYALERNAWSVHFNASPDGLLFAGDGGDEEMVAHAPDGKWIYLFRPEAIPDVAGISAENAESLIRPGVLRAERLVDLRQHDYRLEPNVTFSPDGRWIVFRSNLHGPVHVYAVEVK